MSGPPICGRGHTLPRDGVCRVCVDVARAEWLAVYPPRETRQDDPATKQAARAWLDRWTTRRRPGPIHGTRNCPEGEQRKTPSHPLAKHRPHGEHCYPWDWQYGDAEPNCIHQRSGPEGGQR